MYAIFSANDDDTEITVEWVGDTTEQEAREELKKLAGDLEIRERDDTDPITLICAFGGYTMVMDYSSIQLHRLTTNVQAKPQATAADGHG